MKKIFAIIITLILFLASININASEVKIPVSNGSEEYITYNNGEYVTIPTEFTFQEKEFRGVWISNFAGDMSNYTTEAKFKSDITEILDILEYYNYNAVIFHIRTHNNALYKSSLNPKASFWGRVDFDKFDPLEWLIEETHKRGMEFHAWMNPYRVKSSSGSSYCSGSYPKNNPASDTSNLLYGDTVILNPAKEKVKSFLVQTCMEVVKNYDVDAIHFDDYFYTDGIGNSDDSDYLSNNPNGLSKADWRRSQVDDFIKRLSAQIKAYNVKNGKSVQLGIAPGGTYKDGNGKVTYDSDGNAITTGSLTNSGGHYGDYWYADTLKWINEEWIDYILPQCYHGMELKKFAALVDWWDAVVKNKKVNLYIGIGFYMEYSHWQREDELRNQFYFMNKHENVSGFAIYKYSTLKSAYTKKNKLKASQAEPVYELSWNKKCLPALIERYSFDAPTKVNDLAISKLENGYEVSFEKVDSNKFYAIYKSSDGSTSIDNLVKVTSGENYNNKTVVSFESDFDTEYIISVVPLAENNTLGETNTISTTDATYKVEFVDEDGNILDIKYAYNNKVSEPSIDIPSDKILEYSSDLNNITENTTIIVKIVDGIRNITFEYLDENYEKVIETKEIHGEFEYPKVPEIKGYKFIEFVLKENNYYVAKYEIDMCKVAFLDFNGNIIKTIEVEYGTTINEFPKVEDVEGYNFLNWSYTDKVKGDISIKAEYEKIVLKVTFKTSSGEIIEEKEVSYGESVEMIKEVKGYTIEGFYLDGKEITSIENLKNDIEIIVNVKEKSGCTVTNSQTIFYILSVLGLAFVMKKKRMS